LDSAPSYKEEEYEDASPKAQLPVPEELPPPPQPAIAEPVGDLLVIFMFQVHFLNGSCSEYSRIFSCFITCFILFYFKG